MLLSPIDPMNELGDYTTNEGRIHFLFCKNCGVRCIALAGQGEVVEKDVDGEKRKVWVPHAEWKEGQNAYISINAQTLDAGQEGLDLREWHYNKWVCYLDMLDEKEGDAFDRPHRGGTV